MTGEQADDFIYSDELARLLNMNHLTPYRWMRAKYVWGEPAGDERTRHRIADFDALFAGALHTFPAPLTIAMLREGQRTGELRLLKLPEAARRLGISEWALRDRLRRGDKHLEVIKLYHEWRISESSLTAQVEKTKEPQATER